MTDQRTTIDHVDVTTTARNLLTGLAASGYEAQFRAIGMGYFVGGTSAPTDIEDYLPMLERGTLRFSAGGTAPALWVRARHAAVGGPIALRRLPGRTSYALPLGRPHVDATSTPVDLRTGLPAGDYRGVVRGLASDDHLLIATKATAPTDPDDFWSVGRGPSFTFCAGPDTQATWCRTLTGSAIVGIEGGPDA